MLALDDLKGRTFDADSHLYEDRDALTKFVQAPFKDAIQFVEVNGRTKIATRGQISEYIPNPTFERVARPGAQEDYFRRGNPEGKTNREIIGPSMTAIPAFRHPEARIELMDEQGVARTMLFPTLASLVEDRFRDEPDAIISIIHAFNEWMHETWTFNFEDRIIGTPIITLPDVDKAIEELEWLLERGAKAVLIRPAPVPGLRGPRSMGKQEFDPFWKRVEESQTLVCMHVSDSGYARQAALWDGAGEYTPFKPSALRKFWGVYHTPMADALASMVCEGLFGRFPDIKIASMENGSAWFAPMLEALEDTYVKMPQEFPEAPRTSLDRSFYINPFWEDDVTKLADSLPLGHILWGSDFPHPEGLAEPLSYLEHIRDLSDTEILGVMGGNLSSIVR